MASIILSKIIRTDPIYSQKSLLIFSNAVRNHWNYQYKPGPCPKTPEERAAAAKKYGLTVEEYQPYPESACYGDYPKMPDIGADSKDPHYPYDCPEFKRNFNEPIHATAEIFGEDRYDPSMRPRFSITFQFMCLMAALGGSWIAFTYLEDFKIGRPVIQKQYPGQGTHYLFCPK